jgi:hypothetical protein
MCTCVGHAQCDLHRGASAPLDSLVESLPTVCLLLLVNYRTEYQHGWGSKTYYTQVRLDPLPPASADALLQAHCHRGLGRLYAATGQREPARTALSTALEMYRAMGMTFWLP